ncbi:MAG: DUF1844 domain-containing protein [Polyangiales bacterium]
MSDEHRAENDDEPIEAEDIQPMSFDIFVLSLNASALIHLGESRGAADTEHHEVNLPLARQTIDILSMLEAKTRGNLSGEEERLLHQILFDLRMRYSKRAGR